MTPTTNDRSADLSRARRRAIGTAAIVLLAAIALVAIIYWRTTATRNSTTTAATAADSMPTARGEKSGKPMASPADTGTAIQITASQLRQFGITFGTAERRTLQRTVRTVGTVMVDEARRSQIAPKFGGFVERLYVDQTGQRVRRGDPLMDVYSPELVAAEQELLIARNLEKSTGGSAMPGVPPATIDLLAGARRRLQSWDISDAQIDEILKTGTVKRTLTLHAPASGVVLQKSVVQGQAIQPGQALYDIADLSSVWIDVALREADVNAVRVGSKALVDFAGYAAHPLEGRVAYIYPTLDSASRSMRARIAVANRDGRLMPGMYATVTLATPVSTALTVPSSAVLRTGTRALVFVDAGGGRLEPRVIRLGRVTDELTEVVAGLEPGQRVVTSAQFLLDSESNLAEVMRGMVGQQGMSDSPKSQNMQDMPGLPAPAGRDTAKTGHGSGMKDTMAHDTSRLPIPPGPR